MITLVGVGHVFDIRSQVYEIIINKKPSIVCIELDETRYAALRDKEHKRDAPLPYKMLAFFQERIALKYGAQIGSEMLAAVDAAKAINAEIAFIDLNAAELFNRIWNNMSLKERVKLFLATFSGFFARKEIIEEELKRFEENSEDYIKAFGSEFPTMKIVLIDDRNSHMAQKLRALSTKYENIVAVIGDGHIEGVAKLLSDLKFELIRLSHVRKIPQSSTSQVTVSFSYKLT